MIVIINQNVKLIINLKRLTIKISCKRRLNFHVRKKRKSFSLYCLTSFPNYDSQGNSTNWLRRGRKKTRVTNCSTCRFIRGFVDTFFVFHWKDREYISCPIPLLNFSNQSNLFLELFPTSLSLSLSNESLDENLLALRFKYYSYENSDL